MEFYLSSNIIKDLQREYIENKKIYGEYYLLQDNELKDNTFDISIIKKIWKYSVIY